MGEEELKRIRFEIMTMVAANPKPMYAARIAREYDECFGQSLDVLKYGYMTLTAFLDDHPKLNCGMFEGMKCYQAGVSDNADAQDIQRLIKGQRKKKKSRGGRKGNFHRNTGYTRSERYQPKTSYPGGARASLREPYLGNRRSGNFYSPTTRGSFGAAGTTHVMNRSGSQLSSNGHPRNSVFSRLTVPEDVAPFTSQPRCSENCDPSMGVKRIMAALKDCGGRAPLFKLCNAYQRLFSTPLTGAELNKYFGTNNIKTLETTHLRNQVVVTELPGNNLIIASTKMLEEAREDVKKRGFTIIHKAEMKFDKPSLVTLKDHLVKMLENMYPEKIKIDDIAVAYQRAHGVQVDPVSLFAKTWQELINGTLTRFFVFHPDRTVGLTDPFIRNLKQKRENAIVLPKHNVVPNLEQLGLVYESDSDDESDTESASHDGSLDVSSVDSTLPNSCSSRVASKTTAVPETISSEKEAAPVCIPRRQLAFGFLKRPNRTSPLNTPIADQQKPIANSSSNLPNVTEGNEFESTGVTRVAVPTTCLGRMATVAGFSPFKQENHSSADSSCASKPAAPLNRLFGVFKRLGSTSKKSAGNDVNPPLSQIPTVDTIPKNTDIANAHVDDRFKSSYVIRYHGKKLE